MGNVNASTAGIHLTAGHTVLKIVANGHNATKMRMTGSIAFATLEENILTAKSAERLVKKTIHVR